MSFRIHFFSTPPPPIVSFVYSEITRKSAWQVLLRTPSLAIEGHQNLTHFGSGPLISRTFLPHAESSCTSLFVFSAPYTKKGWRTHSLADTVAPILTIPVYSELSYNWGTGLPCQCPSWIYCTGQQHKAYLFPCLFSCLPSLYLQLMCHGSYLPFAQILSFHTCTIPPECWLTLFKCLPSPSRSRGMPFSPHSAAEPHISI